MGHKPVHLVFVEEREAGDGVDHNKFYDMFERNGETHCLWGRRQDGYEFGVSGKLTVKPVYEWETILRSKLAKGYEDYSYLYDEVVTTVASTGSNESMYATIPNRNIADIVDRLQKFANDVIKANYSVKTGQVTKIMVDETQKILDSIMCANSVEEFNAGLLKIFKIIPRSMNRVDAHLLNPNNVSNIKNAMASIISSEQDLLDIMRGQIITPVKGQKVQTAKGDKKTILELNGIIMEEVTAKDVELIKTKLGSNASLYKNAWRVVNEKQKSAYDRYLADEGIRRRDTKLLWHGTRNENVWNILKTGLVLRPTNAVITGKMFGYGVYFAPQASKSINYSSLSGSYWSKGNSNSGFMVLHEVAYGKPYVVDSFDSKYHSFDYAALRRTCPGANCLHARGGTGMLRNDEIIVYKEEQLSALYLVELAR